MSYRDDLDSALARADAAERELAAVRAELAAATAGTVPPERVVRLESDLAAARARLTLLPAALWTAVVLGMASVLLLVALFIKAGQSNAAQKDAALVRERCAHVVALP